MSPLPDRFRWARFPAVRMTLLFGAGILAARYTEFPLPVWGLALLLTLAAWFIAEWTFLTTLRLSFHLFALSLYMLSLSLFGSFRMSLADERSNRLTEAAAKLDPFVWEELKVSGTIQNRQFSSTGNPLTDIRTDTLYIETIPWTISLTIRVYGDPADLDSALQPGSRIYGSIRLYELGRPSNPHEFNYRNFLLRRGITLHGEWAGPLHAEPGGRRFTWHTIRSRFHTTIDHLYPAETAPLAKALLAGYKQEIGEEKRLRFQRAGLAHIMAVSGLHVGFLVAPFWLIIPWLWRTPAGKAGGFILLTLLLLFYAGLTGFTPSVCRASLMAWMLTAGKLCHKTRDSLNLLGASALILLILDPNQLFDPGFQLSYSAAGVILLTLPVIREWIPEKWRGSLPEKMILIVAISVLVQAGLFPLLAFLFREYSLAGPLANLLVIPALTLFVPLSLLLTTLSQWIPLNGLPVNEINILLLDWIWFIADEIGGREGAWISTGRVSLWIFPAWISLFGLIATCRNPAIRTRYLTALLITLNLWLLSTLWEKGTPASLTMTLLDVGQGDAIHLRTPEGRHLLVDTGRWTPSGESGSNILIPYLREAGAERLDGVVITHPHADHIGGLPALMESIQIDTIYTNGFAYTSGLYRTYKEKAEAIEVPEKVLRTGDQVDIDPSIRLFVLGPDADAARSSPNNQSVILLIVYHQTRFLLTGDAEYPQELKIIERYGDFLRTDFLKIGHHGSRTSTRPGLLDASDPSIAAASLAFRNRFGHPHPETVQRLLERDLELYFTSLEGALVFRSDGRTIRQINWRKKSRNYLWN